MMPISISLTYGQANGFYGSKGVSGRLPEGYTLLEQRFMRQVRQAGLEWLHDDDTRLEGPAVQLNEWEREGWTYHAKGTASTFLIIDSLTHAYVSRDLGAA